MPEDKIMRNVQIAAKPLVMQCSTTASHSESKKKNV